MSSRASRLFGFAVVVVGVVLSVSAFLLLERMGQRERTEQLRGQAFERILQIGRTIQADMASLRAFRGLFQATAKVDHQAFHRFREAIELAPSVSALSWAPRVPAADLERFERDLRGRNPSDFGVWQLGDGNRPVAVARTSEHFPVQFNERTVPGRRPIVGYDLASNDVRRQVIEVARLTGEMVATPPIPLITALGADPSGFLVVAPVFVSQDLPPLMQRLERTRGLVIGVFQISQFVREALGDETQSELVVRIFDRTDVNEARAIFASEKGTQAFSAQHDRHVVLAQRVFDVAGRKWDVIVSIDRIPGQYQRLGPWLALLAGLVLSGTLWTVLHLAEGRQAYAERVADQRTGELVRIAERLNAEVSERRSVQDELLRSRERLQDSIESLDDGFALYDADHRLQLWNRRYADYAQEVAERIAPGVSFAELDQAGNDDGGHVGDGEVPPDREICGPRGPAAPGTREHRLPDGRWLLVKLQRTSEGGLVDIRTDVTHLKARAEELELHRDRLEDLVAERTRKLEVQAVKLLDALEKEREYSVLQGEFVSMVSHEFRTPLSIIDASAQRIERKADKIDPTSLRERIGRIRNAVRRLVSLIESTLSFARIESGKLEINPRESDLKAILSDLCDQQRQLAGKHQIVERLDALPGSITADPDLLVLVFSNLLSNAVKYSPDADRVEVTGGLEDDGSIRVSVRDFGLGIPEDDLPRLFDRFYRATNVTGIAGTGIGLNLSHTLVELHGGTIQVQSVQDEGSIFTVRLPRRADLQAPAEPDPGLPVARAG